VPALLIVFAGPPCAGKSTTAATLAVRLDIPHLAMDTTRQRIMPHSPHTRADRAVAYRAMHFAAELLLGHGVSTILDAPYGHPEDRTEVARIAAHTGAAAYLVECAVSPATAVARLAQRGPDPIRIDLTPARVEEMVRNFRYSGAGLLLDSERLDPAACAARVAEWIAAGRPSGLDGWV